MLTYLISEPVLNFMNCLFFTQGMKKLALSGPSLSRDMAPSERPPPAMVSMSSGSGRKHTQAQPSKVQSETKTESVAPGGSVL